MHISGLSANGSKKFEFLTAATNGRKLHSRLTWNKMYVGLLFACIAKMFNFSTHMQNKPS